MRGRGSFWKDDLVSLVGAHEVDEMGDRGMREKGQWRSAGYGCSVQFESFQYRCAFKEAGYVSIK